MYLQHSSIVWFYKYILQQKIKLQDTEYRDSFEINTTNYYYEIIVIIPMHLLHIKKKQKVIRGAYKDFKKRFLYIFIYLMIKIVFTISK